MIDTSRGFWQKDVMEERRREDNISGMFRYLNRETLHASSHCAFLCFERKV